MKNDKSLPYFYTIIPLNSRNIDIEKTKVSIKILNIKEYDLKNLSELNIDSIFSYPLFFYKIYKASGKSFLQLYLVPFIKKNNSLYKILSFKISWTEYQGYKREKNIFKNTSVLASGYWYKIKVDKTGVYKLTYSQLREMGFSDPAKVRLFGAKAGMLSFYNQDSFIDDLQECKIFRGNDYIMFFAKAPDVWTYSGNDKMFLPKRHLYSRWTYYFLTDKNTGFDNQIDNVGSTESYDTIVSSYISKAYHELDEVNLLKSGRKWYGEYFGTYDVHSFDFKFDNIITDKPVRAKISLVVRSVSVSSYEISAGNYNFTKYVPPVCAESWCRYAVTADNLFDFYTDNTEEININIKYNKPTPSSSAWLDYIVLNAYSELSVADSQVVFFQLPFNKNIRYKIKNKKSSTKVWDVSNELSPRNISFATDASYIYFNTVSDTLKQYVIFSQDIAYIPVIKDDDVGQVKNQNLHGSSAVRFLIITHPLFSAQANRLAELHEKHDNISVSVVTTEEIYNEFSSGAQDVSAIRNFIRMIYLRSYDSDSLKYVLLFGDGSVDNLTKSVNNTNYIPTYESDNSLNEGNIFSFVTDDFFGLLDENEGETNGLLDVGIGRFTVKNVNEAESVVNKVENYLSNKSFGAWRNKICFVADDEDNNTHISQADNLAQYVETKYPVFNIKKIYIDAYRQVRSGIGDSYPEATIDINNTINSGILIFNYTGHGGADGLAHERIMRIDDIKSWTNKYALPLFVTATCEFCRFDYYSRNEDKNITSAGEYVFLNPHGGAIALFTTTRPVYSSLNYTLNRNFYVNALEKDYIGKPYCFGDMIRMAKILTADRNMLNFLLIGDPALRLPVAEKNVFTSKINNIDISTGGDTIKALAKVKITGNVLKNNSVYDNFNGVLSVSVYDKQKLYETQNNDGDGVFSFTARKNIIFRGKSRIKNGRFEFSFLTPKDIAYNMGLGKISYYANDENTDFSGFDYVLVGGVADSVAEDTEGPEIKLYFNDENFAQGGIIGNNSVLIAKIRDESGINTTALGIGHDITAIIDNDKSQTYMLNDYFETELDDYTSGQLKFTLNNLKQGSHKLKLTAWDTYNNSSSQTISFRVYDSKQFTVGRVFNYPNPFTTSTDFYFEHNAAGQNLQVNINIYTISGKFVKSLYTEFYAQGNLSNPIHWDGYDNYGNKIARGTYIYYITVKNEYGESVKKLQKLLILE